MLKSMKKTLGRPFLSFASTWQIATCVHKKLQHTCVGVEDPLQHSWDKKIIQHFFHLPQVFYVQDSREWRLVGPHQGQDARGLLCFFGSSCERQKCCHDLAQEFASIVWILYNCLGDDANEGTYDDYVMVHLMHEMLKHKENEPQGEDAAMALRQSKGGNLFPRQNCNIVLLL